MFFFISITFVYISIVKREDEDKLGLNTPDAVEGYIKEAPSSAPPWLVGKKYDKTHVRWHTPNPNSKFGKEPLPAAGVGTGERYAKRLIYGTDSTFFVRPDNWRCSRRHSPEGCRKENVEYGQYEYKPQYIENDEKVAYSNPKYPWLVAAAKYKIAYKRPQDYDLVMLKFPEYAKAGEYVIQYMWRGYYDCFDTVLVDGGGGSSDSGEVTPPPELITEEVWVKRDHCQYEKQNVLFKNSNPRFRKCFVIDSRDSKDGISNVRNRAITENFAAMH